VILRKQRRAERLKLEVLQKHALDFDVDPEVDYARPGNSPPERAFHLLGCGFDLLIAIADKGFPSLDRRTRQRGGKWIQEELVLLGREPSQFLAHAIPALFAASRGRLDNSDQEGNEELFDPEHHRALGRTLADFYPLPKEIEISPEERAARKAKGLYAPGGPERRRQVFRHVLDECLAEFHVMERHQPREEVARGVEPANEYSLALLHGQEPNDDPELVETQRRYARDFFINRASLNAIKAALDAADFRLLSDKLIEVLEPGDRRISEYRTRELAAWIEGTRSYREYALIEFRSESP
jgi:hypothetical protein